ncbi:MAG TPA: nitroreductase family protein [Acidimicrobiia bacterium]
MSDDLFAVAARQRACRTFSTEPVDDDVIARLLTTATFAPSAENKQPWEFVVVRDDATRAAIGDLSRRAWDGRGRAFSEARLTPRMLAEVDHGATGGVANAPVNIVVCADGQRGLEATIPSSIFPAVQNLLLAATALGLGSALTTITTGYRAEMQAILGLPEPVWPIALVPIGHPARALGPPRRAPFAEHTHRERYGQTW